MDSDDLTPAQTVAVAKFVVEIKLADIKHRQAMMDALRENICIHCGTPDPVCHCWNDA